MLVETADMLRVRIVIIKHENLIVGPVGGGEEGGKRYSRKFYTGRLCPTSPFI